MRIYEFVPMVITIAVMASATLAEDIYLLNACGFLLIMMMILWVKGE